MQPGADRREQHVSRQAGRPATAVLVPRGKTEGVETGSAEDRRPLVPSEPPREADKTPLWGPRRGSDKRKNQPGRVPAYADFQRKHTASSLHQSCFL